MKRLACCTFLATAAMAQNFPIDHVTVAGKDLKAMQKALDAVGVRSVYGGPHSNHATEMALASFPDGSYLELIAIQPKADPTALAAHYWHKFMEADAGPCAHRRMTGRITARIAQQMALLFPSLSRS